MSGPSSPESDSGRGGDEAPTSPHAAPGLGKDSWIGPYHLLHTLGEGGFGVVYEAEQREPVRRRVALKIIKPGMDSRAVVARFEAERQALAVMDHPGIATVYDAGVSPEGRPYFVMELVRGEAVTDFCDKHRLSLRDRCDLFILICEAVQHAHAKGVIHRDLKPGNILVFYEDGRARTKIIDFGVAKALNQRLTEATIFTERGQLIGTPEYMSPEQAEMSSVDVDTRSDVYSLGVLLYELLVGRTPFDRKTLRAAGLQEIQRIIREVDPPKPSTRLDTALHAGEDPDTATRIINARRSDPQTLMRLLRSDLDWVVMRCLEKDRERRYATTNGLAMELRRFLNNEPVLAGPPSVGYRLRKFVRRRRVPVAAAAAVLFAVVGFGGVAGVMWRSEARQRARAERAETEAVEMLHRLSEYVVRPAPIDTGEAEEAAFEARMERDHADDPAGEARARLERALALYRAGEAADMARHAERAAALFTELGHEGEQRVDALTLAGIANRRLDLYDKAESYAREALALGETLFGAESDEAQTLWMNVSVILNQSGRHEEAIAIIQRVLERRTERHGPGSREAIVSGASLLAALREAGRYMDAVDLGRSLLADARESLGPDDEDALQVANNLGLALVDAGADREALPLLRDTLERVTALYGEEHMRTVVVKRNLAAALRAYARHREAERLLAEAIETHFALTRIDSDELLGMMVERAESLVVLGESKMAETILIVAEALCDRLDARGPRDYEAERARIDRLRQRAAIVTQ